MRSGYNSAWLCTVVLYVQADSNPRISGVWQNISEARLPPHGVMANHSANSPLGTLSYDTIIQSWFGIQGQHGAYSGPWSRERILENWHRRSISAPILPPPLLLSQIHRPPPHIPGRWW